MKTYKIKIFLLVICLMSLLIQVGCGSSSETSDFKMENGETVKITLDTSENWTIEDADNTFTIKSEDGKELARGGFMTASIKENIFGYISAFNGTGSTKILDEKDENGISYIFYYYEEKKVPRWVYIIKAEGSETGIQIISETSQKTAESVMKHLQFDL